MITLTILAVTILGAVVVGILVSLVMAFITGDIAIGLAVLWGAITHIFGG